MSALFSIGVLFISYLLGSIPTGLVIVRLKTGKDLRTFESGRTGGTNTMRAAGFLAGLVTAILDILKSAAAARIAIALQPENLWLHILAPAAAILGHNYSIFLAERSPEGHLRLRGGAGGAPCVGGSLGLWAPSIFIIVPIGVLLWYFLGYASVATLSVAVLSTILFGYRAWAGAGPWEYALYGVLAGFLLAWSLRPNIQRLIAGNERMIGFRAKKRAKVPKEQS